MKHKHTKINWMGLDGKMYCNECSPKTKQENSALCIHCSNSPCTCSHYPDCNLNNYGSCDCERNYNL